MVSPSSSLSSELEKWERGGERRAKKAKDLIIRSLISGELTLSASELNASFPTNALTHVVNLTLDSPSKAKNTLEDLELPQLQTLKLRGQENFTIPKTWQQFTNLKQLTIEHLTVKRLSQLNTLTSLQISTPWRIISTNYTRLTNLKELSLTFHGCILSEDIRKLTALQKLSINSVDGLSQLPPLKNFNHLKYLDFTWDVCMGTIDETLGQLTSLETLIIRARSLNTIPLCLPANIGQLNRLNHLFLNFNIITYPPQITTLTHVNLLTRHHLLNRECIPSNIRLLEKWVKAPCDYEDNIPNEYLQFIDRVHGKCNVMCHPRYLDETIQQRLIENMILHLCHNLANVDWDEIELGIDQQLLQCRRFTCKMLFPPRIYNQFFQAFLLSYGISPEQGEQFEQKAIQALVPEIKARAPSFDILTTVFGDEAEEAALNGKIWMDEQGPGYIDFKSAWLPKNESGKFPILPSKTKRSLHLAITGHT